MRFLDNSFDGTKSFEDEHGNKIGRTSICSFAQMTELNKEMEQHDLLKPFTGDVLNYAQVLTVLDEKNKLALQSMNAICLAQLNRMLTKEQGHFLVRALTNKQLQVLPQVVISMLDEASLDYLLGRLKALEKKKLPYYAIYRINNKVDDRYVCETKPLGTIVRQAINRKYRQETNNTDQIRSSKLKGHYSLQSIADERGLIPEGSLEQYLSISSSTMRTLLINEMITPTYYSQSRAGSARYYSIQAVEDLLRKVYVPAADGPEFEGAPKEGLFSVNEMAALVDMPPLTSRYAMRNNKLGYYSLGGRSSRISMPDYKRFANKRVENPRGGEQIKTHAIPGSDSMDDYVPVKEAVMWLDPSSTPGNPAKTLSKNMYATPVYRSLIKSLKRYKKDKVFYFKRNDVYGFIQSSFGTKDEDGRIHPADFTWNDEEYFLELDKAARELFPEDNKEDKEKRLELKKVIQEETNQGKIPFFDSTAVSQTEPRYRLSDLLNDQKVSEKYEELK